MISYHISQSYDTSIAIGCPNNLIYSFYINADARLLKVSINENAAILRQYIVDSNKYILFYFKPLRMNGFRRQVGLELRRDR